MSAIIDLTHPLRDGQPGYPGDPSLTMEPHATTAADGYNVTRIAMGLHQGTHLDAPYHFFDDGRRIDDMPLDVFYGPAAAIDLAPGGMLDPKTAITSETLAPYDALFQPGARILCRTGWDRMFGTPGFFTEGPQLTVEAARWIASRKIALFGMDTPTPSVDDVVEVHQVLLERDVEIVIVEGLVNLERLPPQFTFIGFPLRFASAEASPIRAVAVVE